MTEADLAKLMELMTVDVDAIFGVANEPGAKPNRAARWVLDRIFKKQVIGINGDDYLSRWLLFRLFHEHVGKRLGLPAAFIHFFHRSDADCDLHDHPWEWSLSLILTGGYTELRYVRPGKVSYRYRRPMSLNLIRGNDFHRALLFDQKRGAWTFFVHGKRNKHWGFLNVQTGAYRDHVYPTKKPV